MTLKSLIQRLLDSRTTPAQAGHASKPSSTVPVDYNPSASVDNWGPVLSNSTAVSDGYIWAAGRTTSDKGFFQINTQALQITTTGTSNPGGEILNLFTPVSKGQLFSVYGRYLEQITVRLVKTIGGGYNSFVRRALSCLRPSFNYLPRSFCKAKNSGLAVKHSLKQLLHWMFRHVPSLHRLMGILDTSILSAVEANSCSIWIRVKKYLAVKSLVIAGFLQQTPTARQQYLSRKAVLLLLLPTRCSIKFGLLRLQARHNLRTGGALC